MGKSDRGRRRGYKKGNEHSGNYLKMVSDHHLLLCLVYCVVGIADEGVREACFQKVHG